MRLQHVLTQQLRRLLRRYALLRRASLATLLLTITWLAVIYWGERSVYAHHIDACHWEEWERWPQGAQPHHLVLVADPQLVDPHTYPGRPWPLSTLTEKYTDLYMSRNFRLINSILDPDSVVFLGDLFDGGREWAPETPKKLTLKQRQTLIDWHILPEGNRPAQAVAKRDVDSYKAADTRPHSHEAAPGASNSRGDDRSLREFVPGENGRWSKWTQKQWLADLARFSNIFLDQDQLYPHENRELFALYDVSADPAGVQNGAPSTGWREYATSGGRRRRIITSLPGNHDLGFGPGVQLPIRDRFQSHFGEGNRIDIIGNHTFVSLDSPSLSAHSFFAPNGFETDTEQDALKHIWLPSMQFMEQLRAPTRKAVAEALRDYYPDQPQTERWTHDVTMAKAAVPPAVPPAEVQAVPEFGKSKPNLPVILLSHVPLYRPPDTSCGPLRESPNPIQIRMGYQYQNVLTPGLSKEIVIKITEAAGDIVQVFSGDDHDYCDIEHRFNIAPTLDVVELVKTKLYHIREITVKSFSWAMGVRRPGFVLVSLWNPVDKEGVSLSGSEASTIQTHLCLLPDQLSIFLDYAMLFLLTAVLVIIDALYWSAPIAPSLGTEDNPLSPTSQSRMSLPRFNIDMNGSTNGYASPVSAFKGRQRGTSTSSASHSRSNSALLSVQRNHSARTRSVSPDAGTSMAEKTGYHAAPVKWADPSPDDSDEESHLGSDYGGADSQGKWKWRRRTRVPERLRTALVDLAFKLVLVGVPCGLWYLLLVRSG